MSNNKSARDELIRRYGAECFIEKLHLRKDKKPRHYTSKGQRKRMKELTYHHIKMEKDGGKSTVENGALLSVENHQWFHQQSQQAQDYMNVMFQAYKKNADECKVVVVDNLDLPFDIKPVEFSVNEKGKFNRAKEKRETKKLIKDSYEK